MKRVVAALIVKDGAILVCQRTRHQPMPLKWEFPGGKIEDGEQPRDALRRELGEELGIDAKVGDEVGASPLHRFVRLDGSELLGIGSVADHEHVLGAFLPALQRDRAV